MTLVKDGKNSFIKEGLLQQAVFQKEGEKGREWGEGKRLIKLNYTQEGQVRIYSQGAGWESVERKLLKPSGRF